MSDVIRIDGIKGFGHHGVSPDEISNGQEFSVDVQLFLDLTRAGASDDLLETVNYGLVAELVYEQIITNPVSLIETLATRIAQLILNNYHIITSVKVTVHKPSAPITVPFSDVSVEIARERS